MEMTTAFETKGGVQDLQPSEPQMTKIAWGRNVHGSYIEE